MSHADWRCPRCGDVAGSGLALYRADGAFNKHQALWALAPGARGARRLPRGDGPVAPIPHHPSARALLSGTRASGFRSPSWLTMVVVLARARTQGDDHIEYQSGSVPYSYSSAVVAGDYAFLGLDRGSGDTFAAHLEDTFAGLQRTLAERGLSLNSLLKVNVWLKLIEDLPEMERGFNAYLPKDGFPARLTATSAFIAADWLLMVDGVAHAPRQEPPDEVPGRKG